MTAEQSLSDEELDDFLREDPDLFVEAVYESRRRQLFRYIKRYSWGVLSPDELKDVFQETMIGLIKRVRGNEVEPEGSMRLVYAIARNQAITARQKKVRLSGRADTDQQLVDAFATADLDGTSFRIRWKFADPLEKSELEEALVDMIASLPDRQKLVTHIFFEIYEEIRERDKLHTAVR